MSMFQQRHFEAIAQVIQDLERDQATKGGNTQHHKMIRAFSDLFDRDNPNFNRDRFERACIPGANVRARTK